MTVSSIRIANASSGNRMQCIEAAELDGDGFTTYMERVVVGSPKLPTTLGTATRGSGGYISASDTFDLTALPTDLTGNLITVGDATLLVVFCEETSSTGTVSVTPLMFDNQSTPQVIGIMDTKNFTLYYGFRRGASSGDYVTAVRVWDTMGAYKIGLHVSSLSSGNTCKLWGKVI